MDELIETDDDGDGDLVVSGNCCNGGVDDLLGDTDDEEDLDDIDDGDEGDTYDVWVLL